MATRNVDAEKLKEINEAWRDHPSLIANNAPFTPGSSTSLYKASLKHGYDRASSPQISNGCFSSSNAQKEKISNTPAPETATNKGAIFVAPLNSVPYVRRSLGCTSPPRAVFNHSYKIEVTRTGSAALGEVVGRPISLYDIAESDETYYFRVLLPGVSEAPNDFTCEIEPNGKVTIIGITLTGEQTVCRSSQVFKMLTQNLPPPGEFSITFQLPGPVSNKGYKAELSWGSFKCIVKKKKT